MARASVTLVLALRETAARLQQADVTYRWSHFAHCNCGHLAQTLTRLRPGLIYAAANQREGDWTEQATRFERLRPDYGDRPALDEGAWEPEDVGVCRVTGAPMESILAQLAAHGLEAADLQGLERLSDARVRRRLGNNTEPFAHYRRENVIAYLLAWAELLEEELGPSFAASDSSLPLAAE